MFPRWLQEEVRSSKFAVEQSPLEALPPWCPSQLATEIDYESTSRQTTQTFHLARPAHVLLSNPTERQGAAG